MISNIEENLKLWSKTKDEKLFTEHLYDVFRYYAAHICTKYNIPSNNIAETVSDLVSHTAITFPETYNEKKGTAKSALYMIMSRYLFKQIRDDGRQRRDNKKLIFIEDMEHEELECVCSTLYEFQADITTWDDLKKILIENKDIFRKLNSSLKRDIAAKIIDLIEKSPEIDNYILYISKQLHCSKKHVYGTIKEMKQMIE